MRKWITKFRRNREQCPICKGKLYSKQPGVYYGGMDDEITKKTLYVCHLCYEWLHRGNYCLRDGEIRKKR